MVPDLGLVSSADEGNVTANSLVVAGGKSKGKMWHMKFRLMLGKFSEEKSLSLTERCWPLCPEKF